VRDHKGPMSVKPDERNVSQKNNVDKSSACFPIQANHVWARVEPIVASGEITGYDCALAVPRGSLYLL